MTLYERWLVYPDGETQETEIPLRVNQVVDLNGRPLSLPLANPRVIAYRVYKVRTEESRGLEAWYYYLELVPVEELG
jgi:hypothetical protein